ncbi:hypothetical protein [Luteitalea pratensis]|uniref:hypothetical protein n=1 Tax=Luteitalea pratensis TaxID=1855912 RepID=UPI0012FF5BD7|nr:hypothetical protein [Luteitalea pratensis]
MQVIDRDLRVVGLREPLGRLHDPRLGIGEVVLRLRQRLRLRWRRPGVAGLGLRLGFQRALRLLDARQSILTTLQFSGQFIAAAIGAVGRVLSRIGRFGLREQGRHFVAQLRRLLPHPPVAHRLVLGGIRLDLAAIDGHASHARHSEST